MGKKAGPLRRFIPRKPHSTDMKLYVSGDVVYPFVTNMYLYATRKPKYMLVGNGWLVR